MSTRPEPLGIILTLLVLTGACSVDSPVEPAPPAALPESRLVTIHGSVRLFSDSTTPVPGARLILREITAADEQDIQLTSTYSGEAGRYALTFRAKCGKLYGLLSDHPHYVLGASASIGPLPLGDCVVEDLAIDLWVQ